AAPVSSVSASASCPPLPDKLVSPPRGTSIAGVSPRTRYRTRKLLCASAAFGFTLVESVVSPPTRTVIGAGNENRLSPHITFVTTRPLSQLNTPGAYAVTTVSPGTAELMTMNVCPGSMATSSFGSSLPRVMFFGMYDVYVTAYLLSTLYPRPLNTPDS